ncbi:MAG: radical SAM/SPASM domain-containing protein [Bacillota bacterium]
MWYVSDHCRFVKGAVQAALYDLKEGKVYSLNKTGRDLLEMGLLDPSSLSDTGRQYLAKLERLGLATQTPTAPPTDDTIPLRLDYVWLELTAHCNLRCVHCYGAFGFTSVTDPDYTMTLHDWKVVVDQVRELGCRDIQLIGGEPLAFSGFEEILDYAHRSGMERIDVFTNATLLTQDLIQKISQVGATVRVSLYGHNPEVHEKITRRKGSFAQTEIALKRLKLLGANTSVAVIVLKENEHCISEIRDYIEGLGHRYNGYDTIRSSSPEQKSHCPTNVEVLAPRYNTEPDFQTSYTSYATNKQWNNCWFGKAAITATGDVLPCVFARSNVVGNVKKNDLQTIRDNLYRKWEITKDKVEGCQDCEYRYACHDCRPLSEGLSGYIQAKYPRCCYDPYTGHWRSVAEATIELSVL